MIQGVLSITASSHDLSRQSLNLWWPVQYVVNVATNAPSGAGGGTVLAHALGGGSTWYHDLPSSALTPYIGFNVEVFGLVLLAAFTVLNLRYVYRALPTQPDAIVKGAALQVYAYFMLRVGVQVNHYFILIPILTLVAVADPVLRKYYVAICAVFFAQDMIFYGFGRDLTAGTFVLTRTYLGWTTVVLALCNVALLVSLARYCWSRPSGEPSGIDASQRR
jgi:hypothetical protein